MAQEPKAVSKVQLYLVGSVFALSIGFAFFGIKQCVPYADTLTILTYRFLSAAIAVTLWLAVCKIRGTFPERRPGRPKGGLYKTAIFYILFMILQILAMYFATSIEGAIVFAMVPIFAKIIGRIVLGERSTSLQMVFVVITVVALIVLVILNATSIELNVTGMIIMTISSIFMGFQNVSARYIRGVFAPIEITAAISYLGTAVFVIASLVRGVAGGDFTFLIEPVTHPWFVIWASYLGVFCILLSAQFMSYMLAHMEIIQSTGFSTASTLVSIVAGAVILGEPLRWYHFVCGIVIMGGVVGLMTAPTKEENAGKSLGDEMAGGRDGQRILRKHLRR